MQAVSLVHSTGFPSIVYCICVTDGYRFIPHTIVRYICTPLTLFTELHSDALMITFYAGQCYAG